MEGQFFDNSLPLAALSVGQAEEFFCGLINRELQKIANQKEQPKPDTMTTEELLEFVAEHGYPMTRATVYDLTHKKQIPYTKRRKRIIFSRRDISQWLEEWTARPETKSDAALRLAQSANRKG